MDQEFPLTAPARRKLWQRTGLRLGILAVMSVFFIFVLPRILGLALPFLLAALFASAANPAVQTLTAKLKRPRRKGITALLLAAVLAGIGALLFLAVYTAVADLADLAENWRYHIKNLRDSLDTLALRFNILPERVDIWLENLLDQLFLRAQDVVGALAERGGSRAGRLLSGVSGLFIGIITFVLAAYFFTVDFSRFYAGAARRMSRGMMEGASRFRRGFKASMGGYIKQQLFLSLLAFAIMTAAFFLMGQKYLLLIALFIAAVDFIPVLGAGTVLIPWGALCLLADRVPKGVALLAVWVVIKGSRLLIKTRLPKTKKVLSALQVLIFVYAGAKGWGFFGAVLLPIAVTVAVQVYRTGVFSPAERDARLLFRDLQALCRRPENTKMGRNGQ